jgi:choline dehydrogenase-like flavoprotein
VGGEGGTTPVTDVVDVLVIGAGVSGAVVAKRCAEAGMSVLCLEQGDWPDRSDYPGATPEWELRSAKQWSGLAQLRERAGDYPMDLGESAFGVLTFNGVGGGSVLYSAQWPRMLPDDFRVRSVDGVADDWPIGYADLQPFYEATDRDFGVSGLGGNPMYPPGADPPLPPLPIGAVGLRIARAHARLGWHWWPEPNAILSAGYDGRNPCVQRGSCGSGCNEGAKASTDVTHWPKVLAWGGRVVTGATVRRIVVDEHGLASGVEWVDRDGREHRQRANVVVCAANAIGTARLLLASAGPGHPDGLANSSGLVGRNLMLHPLVSVAGLFDEALDGWRAHAGGLVQCLEFARSDASRGFVRGAKWALGSAGGPLRALFSPDGRGRWGTGHHEHVRERLGRTGSWVIIAEDLPDPDNRVELSPTLADAAGVPAPRVTYRLGENTERLMRWQVERARESLEAAGAWRTEVIRHGANGHLMGTARMGRDPTASVVDPWCVAHDIPNLVIPDGSVFVTVGSANPTSTIAAVALRAAEHLIARRTEMPTTAQGRVVAGFAPAPSVDRPRDDRPDGAAAVLAPPISSPTRTLTASQRTLLRDLADILIPAADAMPSASAVGVGDALVDRVLRARPDLVPALHDALAHAARLPVRTVEALTVPGDRHLAALRYVVAGAYYLAPEVRAALAYEPDRVAPVRALEFPQYIAEGLLDHVVEAVP